MSPFPSLVLQITDLQSKHCVQVCVRSNGRSGRHPHTPSDVAVAGKETTKEVTNSLWDADSSQRGENALCCFKSKSHLILDTFVPFFPPLNSLILTHHLNKEVRAMIKSSHSVNGVARQNVGPSSCQRLTSASNNPPVLSVTSSLQLSVGVACQWWS